MDLKQISDFYNSFHHIPSEEWENIAPLFRMKTYKKNDFFIQAQEAPINFGVVTSGLFRLYYIDDDGKEWVKTFRATSQLIGTYAEMLQSLPSRTFIQALTESEVAVVNAKDFMDYTQDKLCWQVLQKRIAEWHFIQKENREYEFLKLSALERFENFKKDYANVYKSIPDYHIASYLGITAQALSRLQKNG
jgi:CRP-like cAMP-binding protein